MEQLVNGECAVILIKMDAKRGGCFIQQYHTLSTLAHLLGMDEAELLKLQED